MDFEDREILKAAKQHPGWRPWDRDAEKRSETLQRSGHLKECGISAMPPHILYCITAAGEAALNHQG
jgi:hypothetical protein